MSRFKTNQLAVKDVFSMLDQGNTPPPHLDLFQHVLDMPTGSPGYCIPIVGKASCHWYDYKRWWSRSRYPAQAECFMLICFTLTLSLWDRGSECPHEQISTPTSHYHSSLVIETPLCCESSIWTQSVWPFMAGLCVLKSLDGVVLKRVEVSAVGLFLGAFHMLLCLEIFERMAK